MLSLTRRSLLRVGALVLLSGCGSGSAPAAPVARSAPALESSIATPGAADWPQFGFNAQRSNASPAPTGIDASSVGSLRRLRIAVPGTVDSSPIYLHRVSVAGGVRDVFVATSSYGRTFAIDAIDGSVLWQYVPPKISAWEGSAQITTASPAADPARAAVYAAAPDGAVRKLALSDGHVIWTAALTREPRHEKLASSLGVSGGSVLAATGGYFGDAPTYQGHVTAIARSTGRVTSTFNALCDQQVSVVQPSSCNASGAAIFARGGAVVEPRSGRLLVATGNGPYDGRRNFGDSVLELSSGKLRLRQAFTPPEQAKLNAGDTDLGSGGPALLAGGLVASGGKDGLLRVLDLQRLDGRNAGAPFRVGGSLQTLPLPGRAPIFSAAAVSGRRMFLASAGGTRAYEVIGRRLSVAWSAAAHGTSPVLAGGLLYVYDPDGGTLNVYEPASGRRLAALPAAPGHWNSPVLGDHRIALPVGNANDHARSGALELYYPSG
ncbi:MAG: PQQ-binding-like beta-propeller repeat protein [Solirubrobacteraceae bacterium]